MVAHTQNAICFQHKHVHVCDVVIHYLLEKCLNSVHRVWCCRCSTPHSFIKYSVSISFWHFCDFPFCLSFCPPPFHPDHHHHHRRCRTLNGVKANGKVVERTSRISQRNPFFLSFTSRYIHIIAYYFLRFVSHTTTSIRTHKHKCVLEISFPS